MKRIVCASALALSVGELSCAGAPVMAVLGKEQAVVLEKSSTPPVPGDPRQAAFIDRFRTDAFSAGGPRFEVALPVENPPEWGRTVSAETGGQVEYHESFAGGFVCRLSLRNLLPNHRYILTLNGNPQRQGNDRLPDPVPGLPEEKFYDFLFVTTGPDGGYEATLGIALPAGPYDVRLYVKDTDDFKIVLYRDFFRFAVE